VIGRSPRRGAARWAAALASVCGLLGFSLSASGTFSSWTQGVVTNAPDTAATGTVKFSHAYQSTSCVGGPGSAAMTCAGSIAPTGAATAAAVTAFDTISNLSTVPAGQAFNEQVAAASCAPVSFANTLSPANPQLPRYAVGFRTADPWSGTNATTFDGSTSYASDIVAQPGVPGTLLSLGGTVGWGAWFKTTTAAGGPIFALDSSPAAAGGTTDKVLYMTKSGQLGFAFDNAPHTTGLSTAKYNDGTWHFAYVRANITSVAGIPVASSTTLYVDGAQVATNGSLLSGSLASGYWHLGWAPISGLAYGTGLSNYFAGAVSNMVVFAGGSAPAVPTANPSSQAAFTTFAAGGSEQWILGDSGTSTYTGAVGYLTSTDACTYDTIAWTLGGTTAVTTQTVRSFVSAGALPTPPVAGPAVGGTQTSVISSARVATAAYDPNVAGLHLAVPLSYQVTPAGTTSWKLVFTWTGDPGDVLIA
jgi:hypothetical protein